MFACARRSISVFVFPSTIAFQSLHFLCPLSIESSGLHSARLLVNQPIASGNIFNSGQAPRASPPARTPTNGQ
uniref:Secreted protein n=1 Tax=Panagrellus redivivus TaxID=6233 RepID=A0A7E5A1N5_PANRE